MADYHRSQIGVGKQSLQEGGRQVQSYDDEHLAVDFREKIVLLDQTPMTLTFMEYELLAFLVQHAGEIVPRDALLQQVWGYSTKLRTRTLDVHVLRLRRKLGPYAERYIETIAGVGYRFQPFQAAQFFQAAAERAIFTARSWSRRVKSQSCANRSKSLIVLV
jgi:DNA-binding response OmpR family regulator